MLENIGSRAVFPTPHINLIVFQGDVVQRPINGNATAHRPTYSIRMRPSPTSAAVFVDTLITCAVLFWLFLHLRMVITVTETISDVPQIFGAHDKAGHWSRDWNKGDARDEY